METIAPLSPSPSPSPAVLIVELGSDWVARVTPLIAAAAVLLGIYFAWKAAAQGRHATLLADLSRRWDEPLLAEARQIADSLGANLETTFLWWSRTQDPRGYMLERIPNFFEDLSVLEQVGAIDFEMIRMSLGRAVWDTWEIWQGTVAHLRDRFADPEIYVHFEALARSMELALEEGVPEIEVQD